MAEVNSNATEHNTDVDKAPYDGSRPEGQPELSFGEKAVGVTFNPSQNETVARIKGLYANIIDDLNKKRDESQDGEVKRLCSVAITEAQTAQMWAVKAVTWGL